MAGHLVASLDRNAVLAHLQGRMPQVLTRQDFNSLYDAEVEGVAAEIIDIAGDPDDDDLDSPLRRRALSLGVAASIESSQNPEQAFSDDARANSLQRRFVALLSQLRARYPQGPADRPTPSRYAFAIVPL